MTAPEKPYRVVCIKDTGARVEFSRYTTRRECEVIQARLAELGCAAEIEEPDRTIPTDDAQLEQAHAR
jgi:hypothetical protein